jgi:hypothetical protein
MKSNTLKLILEEIQHSTITVDNIGFSFKRLNEANIKCTFTVGNKLYNIYSNIKTMVIIVKFENKKVELTEKEFILNNPIEYNAYKKAMSEFLNLSQTIKPVKEPVKTKYDKIENFSDKLKEKNVGEIIRVEDQSFLFKEIHENEHRYSLYRCEFQVMNENPIKGELSKYNVVAIVSAKSANSGIIKFTLLNHKNEFIEDLTEIEFFDRFPKIKTKFNKALIKFQRTLK